MEAKTAKLALQIGRDHPPLCIAVDGFFTERIAPELLMIPSPIGIVYANGDMPLFAEEGLFEYFKQAANKGSGRGIVQRQGHQLAHLLRLVCTLLCRFTVDAHMA